MTEEREKEKTADPYAAYKKLFTPKKPAPSEKASKKPSKKGSSGE